MAVVVTLMPACEPSDAPAKARAVCDPCAADEDCSEISDAGFEG